MSSDIWDVVYKANVSFFGEEPSSFALSSYQYMKKNGVKKILELGCGQGRDSLFFASKGIEVKALDCSSIAIGLLRKNAKERNLPIDAIVHDAKKLLPFDDSEFDAVYSHMFLSMHFTSQELTGIIEEVKRVLKPNGLHFFSIRNQKDEFYRKGIKLDDNTYDIDGFQIRFFTRQDVKDITRGFKTLEIREEYEEPVTLYLVSTRLEQK